MRDRPRCDGWYDIPAQIDWLGYMLRKLVASFAKINLFNAHSSEKKKKRAAIVLIVFALHLAVNNLLR